MLTASELRTLADLLTLACADLTRTAEQQQREQPTSPLVDTLASHAATAADLRRKLLMLARSARPQ